MKCSELSKFWLQCCRLPVAVWMRGCQWRGRGWVCAILHCRALHHRPGRALRLQSRRPRAHPRSGAPRARTGRSRRLEMLPSHSAAGLSNISYLHLFVMTPPQAVVRAAGRFWPGRFGFVHNRESDISLWARRRRCRLFVKVWGRELGGNSRLLPFSQAS